LNKNEEQNSSSNKSGCADGAVAAAAAGGWKEEKEVAPTNGDRAATQALIDPATDHALQKVGVNAKGRIRIGRKLPSLTPAVVARAIAQMGGRIENLPGLLIDILMSDGERLIREQRAEDLRCQLLSEAARDRAERDQKERDKLQATIDTLPDGDVHDLWAAKRLKRPVKPHVDAADIRQDPAFREMIEKALQCPEGLDGVLRTAREMLSRAGNGHVA
jgi:hypothetical protein